MSSLALSAADAGLADAVRKFAVPLSGGADDYDALLDRIGDARLVLLGEASHGTHEFYNERAEITKRLIDEKGFVAVMAEADWPDAYRINRYVRDHSQDADAVECLADFARFPAWMWRNADVLDFIGWLRAHNDVTGTPGSKTGFYGLDLYSLQASREAVIRYLDQVDPEAARRARFRYACFEHFGEDSQTYGFATGFGLSRSCQDEVVEQLAELRRHAAELAGAAPMADDESFYAEQNARVVQNAEGYYRSMFNDRVSSWNLRDRHMMETLEALLAHLDRRIGRAKVVVWAHNSHLGDARATDMGDAGELNLGQLVRQRYGAEAVLVGFTTHGGTVTAASDWGGPAERKAVRPSLPGSYEMTFHATGLSRFLLSLHDSNQAVNGLRPRRLERAIGVIYLPRSERVSHYFHASLPEQFDAVIHIDETRAVEPLERTTRWEETEAPETFPSAV